MKPNWVHAMHGATIAGEALPYYTKALLEEQFAYRGGFFGRSIPAAPAPVGRAPPRVRLLSQGPGRSPKWLYMSQIRPRLPVLGLLARSAVIPAVLLVATNMAMVIVPVLHTVVVGVPGSSRRRARSRSRLSRPPERRPRGVGGHGLLRDRHDPGHPRPRHPRGDPPEQRSGAGRPERSTCRSAGPSSPRPGCRCCAGCVGRSCCCESSSWWSRRSR